MTNRVEQLIQWIEQGALKREHSAGIIARFGQLPQHRQWLQFVDKLMLALGLMALSFALLFFIAFNWADMSRLAKFAIIESVLIVTLFGYFTIAKTQTLQAWLLMAAAIQVGVLLAFFGQTYQTGADPWQLFAIWALMILPWALLGRFVPLWLLWMLLVNTAVILFESSWQRESLQWTFLSLTVLNGVSLVLREWAGRKQNWLDLRWSANLLGMVCGLFVTILICMAIFSQKNGLVSGLVYGVWLTAMLWVYRRRIADLFMLATVCLSLILLFTCLFIEFLVAGLNDIGVSFLISLLVIAMAVAATHWLKLEQRAQLALQQGDKPNSDHSKGIE